MTAATLGQAALERIYEGIERAALHRCQSQEHPTAILLGGQPGSGKSALALQAEYQLRRQGGAVVIDADWMRERHPLYKQLSQADPQHAADRTHAQAAAWATRLTDAAIAHRRHLVVDGTMRNPQAVCELARRLRACGYQVEARVMAVDPEVSLTRARLRFEEQVAARGTGRFVNRAQHDAAVAGVVASVTALEREGLVDVLRLHDAHQRPLYENRQASGRWTRPPMAATVLLGERSRDRMPAEHLAHVEALSRILALAESREGARAPGPSAEAPPPGAGQPAALHIGDREGLAARLDAARARLSQPRAHAVASRHSRPAPSRKGPAL